MGMSASQARFLSLTSRKNNVEFEGQQINQQRTTLSNESASYYSELCNMEVPTPPSVDDYTKVTYTFNDGAMTNTVISIIPKLENGKITNNKYAINYLEEWQDDYSIVSSASSLIQKDGDSYKIGSSTLRKIENNTTKPTEVPTEAPTTAPTETPAGPAVNPSTYMALSAYEERMIKYYNSVTFDAEYFVGNDNKIYAINDIEQKTPVNINESDYIIATENEAGEVSLIGVVDGKHVKLDEDMQPITSSDYNSIVPISSNTEQTTEESSTINFPDDEYWNSLDDKQKQALLDTEQYYLAMLREKIGKSDENFYVRYIKNAATGSYEPYFYSESELTNENKYNNQNLGNIPCFTIGSTTKTKEVLNQTGTIEKDASGRYVSITLELEDGSSRTYKLTTTTTTDEEAYNDAMNQYNYKQNEYDHKIQEINSKLEIIQQQDKSLELKLKQLDTEENAISTEMEAVKKVISKNIESSFKTFNA